MEHDIVTGDVESQPGDEWASLEADLSRIAGVERARVFGDGVPTSIHVIAQATRDPDEVAKDVSSVVIATTPHIIAREIVSVVPVDAEPTTALTPQAGRVTLDAVVVASRQDSGWVKVRVRLPDGNVSQGVAEASPTREDRGAASITALMQALEPVLTEQGLRADIDNPLFHAVGPQTLAVVQGHVYGDRIRQSIAGTAFVVDDTATACARAALDALNRYLALPEPGL